MTLLTSVCGGKCVTPVGGIGCSFGLEATKVDPNRATRENIIHTLVVEIFLKLNDETSTAKPLQRYFCLQITEI
jgi:hypothetical protein